MIFSLRKFGRNPFCSITDAARSSESLLEFNSAVMMEAAVSTETLLEVTSDPKMETLDALEALVEIISALRMEARSAPAIIASSHVHSQDESSMFNSNVGRSNFCPE
jgi:hypothetical protein